MIAAFNCVVAHELGHAFTAQRFGVRVPRILLLPIGGMAEFDRIPQNPRQELLIAFAGPAGNLLLVLVLFAAGTRFPADWDPLLFPLTVPEFARHLTAMNVVMGLFNLLPIFPMDGDRVVRALLAMRLPYLGATRWAATSGKLLSLGGMAAMGLMFSPPPWLGMALFAFIFVAGEREYRSVRRREEGERRWQETLTRFYRDNCLPNHRDESDEAQPRNVN
ncbi:MAG: site-2 protease family protein [Candidatus Synoicihabitans palmerolidicus]|nr:site-2 protease family protein [Candidatus Synoicihabitans palmerolidicus]